MSDKYYLVPFENDTNILNEYGLDFMPKYLFEMGGNARGLQPITTGCKESTAVNWRVKYYIVALPDKVQKNIEKYSDVIRIDKDTLKSDLTKNGIPNDNVPDELTSDRRDKIDYTITKWLVNKEDKLSEVIK